MDDIKEATKVASETAAIICKKKNQLLAELRTSQHLPGSVKTLDLYDVDDIRTWRTMCTRCNIARTPLCPLPCCFLTI